MRVEAQLAVLLRALQWELDSAAFDLGGGRYTPEQCQQLADRLAELEEVLRRPGLCAPAESESGQK